jgi:nucleoside-diphosphate-sugar epimerase
VGRRILVTGASGFVGGSLVARLARDGHEVVATVRRPQDVPGAARVASGLDVRDASPAWADAMRGVDAVVHLASLVHEVRDPSAWGEYRRANLEGTRRLAELAAHAGARRFVLVSTAKVMGEGTLGAMTPWREDDAPHPEGPYGTTNLEAERAALDVGAKRGMDVVVLRPPVVYGEGLKANLLRLLRAIDKGRPLPLGAARNDRSLVYVGNLVDAIALALEHPDAAGRTFFVSDDETVSTAELARRMARALGKPRARLVPVPTRALVLAAAALGRRRDAERALASLVVDSSAIRKTLGWSAPFTLDEGLARTAAWYEAHR